MQTDFDQTFVRQQEDHAHSIAVVIPPSATMNVDLRTRMVELGLHEQASMTASDPAGRRFQFDYISLPIEPKLLEDGATHYNGIYEYCVREAVLGVFDLAALSSDEFIWSFASTGHISVIVAANIGEVTFVRFHKPLREALHATLYHHPLHGPGPNTPKFAFQLAVEGLREDGFRLLSSYESGSERTSSRLPFVFGVRVFGHPTEAEPFPLWRELLGSAVRNAGKKSWQAALLNTAFAVESFIDHRLAQKLKDGGFSSNYIEHVLRVGDRTQELLELNETGPHFTIKQVNAVADRLNKNVFKPRNDHAHGRSKAEDATGEVVARALREAASFFWDWGSADERHLLLTIVYHSDQTKLIDQELIEACGQVET